MNKRNNFNQKTYSRVLKPGYEDYKNMPHEFRPFIMFTNADNYNTKILNTDRLGFRKTVYKKKLIGIDDLKKKLKKINILVGGSTAFSMGSISDRNTIHSELTSLGAVCYSLGIRGGASHQELLAFLKFKGFFPKVKNIIIFSGVNDLGLACSKDNIFYKDFGLTHGDFGHSFNFLIQSGSNFNNEKWLKGMINMMFYFKYLANKSKIIKKFFSFFYNFKKSRLAIKTEKISKISINERLKNTNNMIKNDMQTWSMIKNQLKINIIYVLQPVLSWSEKPLTKNEKEIFQLEAERMKKSYSRYWFNKKVYISQKNFIRDCCKKNGIKFFDSNELIIKSDKKKDFFIDLTHLTSYGNKFMALNINKYLVDN